MGRPIRGSRQSSFFPIVPNPSLGSLDSAFQLQEYISLLVRRDPHDVEQIVALPGRDGDGDARVEKPQQLAGPEDERVAVDEACWIYEQLRRLAQDLTHPLITALLQECTRQSCPEMKAGEWLYLCVAHGNSGAMEHCCAIDYIVHTLDSATALLNSPRAFPSRISIPSTSHRHFPSLARRLGRIFAHAYHHHRDTFESAEAESALYARFLALSRRFELVPAEFLVIPPRVEREDTEEGGRHSPVTLLTRLGSEASERPLSPARSPKVGGRTRTDTMYHSGHFVPPVEGSPLPSPRRAPRALGEQTHESNAERKAERERVVAKVVARDFAMGIPSGGGVVGEASQALVKELPVGDEETKTGALLETVAVETEQGADDNEGDLAQSPPSPEEAPLSKAESPTLAVEPQIPSTVEDVTEPDPVHRAVESAMLAPTPEEAEEPEKTVETTGEDEEETRVEAQEVEAEKPEAEGQQEADADGKGIELDEKGQTEILDDGPEDSVDTGTESKGNDEDEQNEPEVGEIESE